MRYTKPKAELITFEVTTSILAGSNEWDLGIWSLRRPVSDVDPYADGTDAPAWE